jgi:hypothetical protein
MLNYADSRITYRIRRARPPEASSIGKFSNLHEPEDCGERYGPLGREWRVCRTSYFRMKTAPIASVV